MLPLRDNVPTRHRPWVTYGLIVANVLVWVLYQVPDLDGSVRELAYHPCEVNDSCAVVGQDWLVTAFTSMFMHADWLHLGGNMLFLWIFGNNVEDAMGHVRYLVFYVLAGLTAVALQTTFTLVTASDVGAQIPNLGASGAISGVLGAYLLLLPTAKVLTLFGWFPIEVPALGYLVFWFLFQLWSGSYSILEPEAGGGVAFFAHVGGFVFGALTVHLVKQRQPLRPSY